MLWIILSAMSSRSPSLFSLNPSTEYILRQVRENKAWNFHSIQGLSPKIISERWFSEIIPCLLNKALCHLCGDDSGFISRRWSLGDRPCIECHFIHEKTIANANIVNSMNDSHYKISCSYYSCRSINTKPGLKMIQSRIWQILFFLMIGCAVFINRYTGPGHKYRLGISI